MLDCKNALANNDGDFDKAVEELRIKGAKDVGKRAERSGRGHGRGQGRRTHRDQLRDRLRREER